MVALTGAVTLTPMATVNIYKAKPCFLDQLLRVAPISSCVQVCVVSALSLPCPNTRGGQGKCAEGCVLPAALASVLRSGRVLGNGACPWLLTYPASLPVPAQQQTFNKGCE